MSSNSEWTQILTAAVERSIDETFSTTGSTSNSTITAEQMIADMKDAIKKIGPPPKVVGPPPKADSNEILRQIRARREYIDSVEKANAEIQRKWDHEFNGKVLEIVRKAIQRGVFQVMIHQFRLPSDKFSENEDFSPIPIKVIEVRYDKYRKDAYRHVREQAEKAVRASMPPPKLRDYP